MIGIYAIRNTKNNKMYIGESIDIEQRWKVHQEDLDNSKHHSYKLQEDYDKSKNKEFRFFVLEEFIFPFNAKLDETKELKATTLHTAIFTLTDIPKIKFLLHR